LSNTNENVTIHILKKFLKLNKTQGSVTCRRSFSDPEKVVAWFVGSHGHFLINTPSDSFLIVAFVFRKTTDLNYILKNINIYNI